MRAPARSDLVQAATEVRCTLGTAETGRMLGEQLLFADVAPLAWKRVEEVHAMKEVLRQALDAKWQESATGPDRAMPDVLMDHDEGFRQRLLLCQGNCKELKPFTDSAKRLLRASSKQSIKEDEKTS